ncbi:helix-turn-helix domain-containing protein [Streptomyces sp. NPDC001502]|uniref:helix-turn-helix domain-containing protein n=1 Tax=Streptomyces sp. NPDC001502 TaxID=3364578 RepID=UPI0036A45BC1
MSAPDGPRVLPDGSVVVPARLTSTVFAATALYLSARTRTSGGALTPEARDLLRALDAGAQGPTPSPATSSEGSVIGDSATLGASEVARVLGCSRRWATYLLGSGRLSAWRVGRTWVTTQRDLDRYRYRYRYRYGEETHDDRTEDPGSAPAA